MTTHRVMALIVMLSGCGTLSEVQRPPDENAALFVASQGNELAALRNQLVELQRRLECFITEIDVKQTCDLLSRDLGEPAVRDNAIRRCMASRGFERDLASCQ